MEKTKSKHKMVITPEQVRKVFDKEQRAQLAKLEQEIDKALVKGETTIGLFAALNVRVKDEIINKYQNAGWEVKYVTDQRDQYLLFDEQPGRIGFR